MTGDTEDPRRFLVARMLLALLGDIIFDVGRVVGGIKWRLGIICPIPTRYRSPRWEKDGDSSC